jgi:hypothetical protein
MPDIWMDVDAALTEVPVNIMPLIDDTDFKTREEAVAYNAAGLEMIWHFTNTAGATTATVVTPTTAGTYDWAHQDGGLYTIEIPASGGASINNDTEGFGWFSGVATGVLPWRGPVIGFRAAALNNALIDDAWSTTRGLAGTALPNAAADAAGGLVVSDAGGLDIDAKLANTNEITATRMQELDSSGLATDIAALPTAAENRAEMDSNSTQLAAIVADTNELQSDDVPGLIATVQADLDTITGSDGVTLATAQALYAPAKAADIDTALATYDGPTNAEMEARTIASASYATATALATAQTDLDTLTGSDGVTLATSQPNYAPATAAALATVDGVVDAILVDTATLGTPAGADFAADIAAIKSDTGAILTDTGTTIPAQIGTPAGADISADIAAVKSDTAATLTDTGTTLPALFGSPAGASVSADIAAVKSDTAAILVDTGTTLDGAITTIDGIVDDLKSGIIYGSAQAGTLSTTAASTTLTGYADDQLIGRVVIWLTGDCAGEATDITDFTGTGGVLTFTALTTAPGNDDTFKIV